MGALELTGPVLTPGGLRGPAWVVDGVITYERPLLPATQVLDGVVLPGLVDVHCHIGLGAAGAVDRATAVAQGQADLAAGVLLVRDAGSPADTSWVHARGDMPQLIRSGRHIARPKRYLRGYAVELDDVRLLPEEVARQARAGDGWVKLVADWIDREVGDLTPLWPTDVLRDAVAAAHDNGARVTAHAFSHEAIDPLLEAGIDSIEHGTGMDADQIAEAAARGIPITPTMIQVDNFAAFAAAGGAKFPAYAARMERMYAHRDAQLAAFVDAGVQLLPGSDAGGTLPHGLMPGELARWVAGGVDPALAVEFATWRARDFLRRGPLADAVGKISVLEEDDPADLVVYESDPRARIAALRQPRAVLRAGQLSAGVS